jgi:hypothetical protein
MIDLLTVGIGAAQQDGTDPDPPTMVGASLGMQTQPV